jgi:hypothetical protein
MKRRRSVRPIEQISSRSLAWADRLTQRYGRLTEVGRLSMLLCVPSVARTLVLLQRRFTTLLTLSPQLNFSINRNSLTNSWMRQVNTTQQMTLLKTLSLAHIASRAGTAGTPTRAADSKSQEDIYKELHVREYESRRRLALTLAINRTSTDLSSTLSKKFSLQRELQFREVSTLLSQRTRRVSESVETRVPMSFRAPATSPRVSAEAVADVLQRRDAFESSGRGNVSQLMQPALNVELLADQVMKQIDRRVIARRERMGQI